MYIYIYIYHTWSIWLTGQLMAHVLSHEVITGQVVAMFVAAKFEEIDPPKATVAQLGGAVSLEFFHGALRGWEITIFI